VGHEIILVLLLATLCQAAAVGRWLAAEGHHHHLLLLAAGNREALTRTSAENFNVVWPMKSRLGTSRRAQAEAMLQSGLLVPETLDDPAKLAELDALIGRVKKHKALEAYYIID